MGFHASRASAAADVADNRRLLVARIAASPLLSKSARLRELLLYLCRQVLEANVEQIHEQEVGHRVFGRPPDYDTTADNIVRVHASLLRKRLAEYFSKEGAHEPIVIEIPKGNYAPVFRERAADTPSTAVGSAPRVSWLVWALGAAAVLFAGTTTFLLLKQPQAERRPNGDLASRPTVHLLWSQLFQTNRPTDIVLDDASIALYQDLTKRPIAVNDYYDRSYLRKPPDSSETARLDRDVQASLLTRRYSSYAAVAPLWKLFQIAEGEQGRVSVQFARDYSFHGLKTNNAILLGSSQSNPWVEPFEGRIGLRWMYDKNLESAYPVDTWGDDPNGVRFRPTGQPGESRDGYCAISFLSNLGASGSVLMISATGGSTMTACSDFLTDEQAVAALHRRLTGASDTRFPYFEALLRIKGRATLPRDINLLVCRTPR